MSAQPSQSAEMLAHALHYARIGLCVFPCDDNKRPLTTHGLKDASTDPTQIEVWWKRNPGALIGAAMGRRSGVFAIDPDVPKKPGAPDGLTAWEKLKAANGGAPHTHTHVTPSGGRHEIYKWNDSRPVTNSPGALPPGVDVRGEGGYVIMAFSELPDGRQYEMADSFDFGQFAPSPAWLHDIIETRPKKPHTDARQQARNSNAERPRATVHIFPGNFSAYVESVFNAEIRSVANCREPGRNNALNRAAFNLGSLIGSTWARLDANRARDRLLEAAHACGLVADDGERACLATIEGGLTSGAANPREEPKQQEQKAEGESFAQGDASDEAGADTDTTDPLEALNELYCVVLDGGKTKVLHFEDSRQKQHTRKIASFIGFDDFRNFHLNRSIQVGDKQVPLGHWWLKHPDRRQYRGLTFEPAGDSVIDGRFNLWRGWGVTPKAGSWVRMRSHIDDVLANGNVAHAAYILNWCAWAVQHPARRAEAAIVFKGRKGTGKGTLGNTLCHIFGQHGTHISSAEHLAGRFNGHLRDVCFLFADEAYWPGDKGAEGSLKRLITEPDLFIEDKGVRGITVPNMLHCMMASNEDWVVPAGSDERRYAVFIVSDAHKQDEAWFTPIYDELANGGLEAMLHDLLGMDLGDWHPRRVPKTEGLLEQQSQGLRPEDAWWCELLQTGLLWGADEASPGRAVSNAWEEKEDTFNGTKLVRHKGLYDQAREFSPRLKQHSDHLLGSFLTNQGCTNDRKVMRRRGWEFPSLSAAREAWELRFPGWRWRDPELKEWGAE